jgi:hypothetical protein
MRLLEFKYVSGTLASPKESFPEGKTARSSMKTSNRKREHALKEERKELWVSAKRLIASLLCDSGSGQVCLPADGCAQHYHRS